MSTVSVSLPVSFFSFVFLSIVPIFHPLSNSCVTVGTTRGYRIYKCQPFGKVFEVEAGGTSVVEMLNTTSLVTVVGAGETPFNSPRQLRMHNTKSNQYICELNFVSTILNVLVNSRRLVAVLERKIHLFELHTMKLLHTLDTGLNKRGVAALSGNTDRCCLAFPFGDESQGQCVLYDPLQLQYMAAVHCHNNQLRRLAFNKEGTMLASASIKGPLFFSVLLVASLLLFSCFCYLS